MIDKIGLARDENEITDALVRASPGIATCIALLALVIALVFSVARRPSGEIPSRVAERGSSSFAVGQEPTSHRAVAEVHPTDNKRASPVDGIAGVQSAFPAEAVVAEHPRVGRNPEAEELLGYFSIDRASLAWEVFNVHTVAIPLGQGRVGQLVLEKKTSFGGDKDAWQWVGKLSGDPYSSAVLTAWKGTIFGTLYGAEGSLEFRQADGNTIEVVRLDVCAQPDCSVQDGDGTAAAGQTERGPKSVSTSQAGPGTRHSDIVVAYNNQARESLGGGLGSPSDNATIEAKIISAVAQANLTYANSGIDLVMRLAWLGMIEYDYPEDEDLVRALTEATNANDGKADVLARKKALYQADFASLWIANEMAGGRANVLVSNTQRDLAFSVVRARSSTDTFVHEVGHNMGCRHLRSDYTTTPSAWNSYAFAHSFTGSDGKVYATVMASAADLSRLGPGATRIPHFSNPSVSYLSSPTGVANSEDCARTIRDNRAIYESFYQTPALAAGVGESAGTLTVALANGFVQQNYQLWRSADLRNPSSWALQGQFRTDNDGKIAQPVIHAGLTNAFYQWRP